MSPDVTVSQAVGCLGNFIDFSIGDTPKTFYKSPLGTLERKDAFTLLMSEANKAKHLPPDKAPINAKARLFNDILT